MNRRELCEVFANRSKPRGKASALYFDGPVIYSYGPHFPAAVIRGTRAFVNSDRYSPSTSRHMSAVRAALDRAGFTITERDTAAMKELVEGGGNG